MSDNEVMKGEPVVGSEKESDQDQRSQEEEEEEEIEEDEDHGLNLMKFYKEKCGKALADYATRFVHLSTVLGKNNDEAKDLIKKYDLNPQEEDQEEIDEKTGPPIIIFPKTPVKIHETLISDFADCDEPKRSMGLILGRKQVDFIGDCLLIVPKGFNKKDLATNQNVESTFKQFQRKDIVGIIVYNKDETKEQYWDLYQFQLENPSIELLIYFFMQKQVYKFRDQQALQIIQSGKKLNEALELYCFKDLQQKTLQEKFFVLLGNFFFKIIYQKQSILEREEFIQRYERNADNLQIFHDDGYLDPFRKHFQVRNGRFFEVLENVLKIETSLKDFAKGYEKYGFIVNENGILYKEWAPGAKEVYITGDFNNWNNTQYSCTPDNFGNWEIFIPRNDDGTNVIPHGSQVKTYIKDANGDYVYRVPAWITTTKQNEDNKLYDGVFWNPEVKYEFKNPRPPKHRCAKIYECHIGMAGIESRVHSFKEFTKNVLPRVKSLGYNTIQIMAIQEHAYYGSFGYHVTNFFAVSSRFGTPDDLKELIDTAHGLGISVLMDLVHSHASSNVVDGINNWDGTDYHYFHAGSKGKHELWDSRLFDYGKWEVLRFLLSNLSWWLNEYQFDGFRFDGITSMLYLHHGMGFGFTGNYQEYFSENADIDSLVYLMLANDLIHDIYPDAITIAEDVSGYPSLCRTIKDGGVGFDYRMAMAVPDKWIKLLKEAKDEDWDMDDVSHTLTNRRHQEKCICYAECHDQALVGDKTLSMWLFDKEIYDNMSVHQPETLTTFRGVQLHKMLRLITFALGGEGYLTFMGNEFGHPEWIDFPRQGNGWSYHYARRRWDLADDKNLRYSQLLAFDKAMIQLEEDNHWLPYGEQYVSLKHNGDKVIAFERGNLVFVFNFHPNQSFEHYRIGTRHNEDHEIVLSSDDPEFGGHTRVDKNVKFPVIREQWCNRPNYIQIYIPNRSVIVFRPKKGN